MVQSYGRVACLLNLTPSINKTKTRRSPKSQLAVYCFAVHVVHREAARTDMTSDCNAKQFIRCKGRPLCPSTFHLPSTGRICVGDAMHIVPKSVKSIEEMVWTLRHCCRIRSTAVSWHRSRAAAICADSVRAFFVAHCATNTACIPRRRSSQQRRESLGRSRRSRTPNNADFATVKLARGRRRRRFDSSER